VKKIGQEAYITEYFKPASESLNEDLLRVTDMWDKKAEEASKLEYKLENIQKVIKNFKDLYKFIDPIMQTSEIKIEGFVALKNIINEFVNFKIYSVLVADNIVDKLQSLIDLKSKIEGKKEIRRVTIDDL